MKTDSAKETKLQQIDWTEREIECIKHILELNNKKPMNIEEMKKLMKNINFYEELMEKDMVKMIEITDSYDRKFGIVNEDGKKAMMKAALRELKRQFAEAKYGDKEAFGEAELENLTEYQIARKLEDALNVYGFNKEAFYRGLERYHRTLRQSFFRLMKFCIERFAESESFDGRDEASHRMCVELAQITKNYGLPMI